MAVGEGGGWEQKGGDVSDTEHGRGNGVNVGEEGWGERLRDTSLWRGGGRGQSRWEGGRARMKGSLPCSFVLLRCLPTRYASTFRLCQFHTCCRVAGHDPAV